MLHCTEISQSRLEIVWQHDIVLVIAAVNQLTTESLGGSQITCDSSTAAVSVPSSSSQNAWDRYSLQGVAVFLNH